MSLTSTLRGLVERSSSQTFRRSFAVILVAEAVTIGVAWLLLGFGISRWLSTRSAQVVTISQQAAAASDWSLVDKVPKDRDSALFQSYAKQLKALSNKYFPRDEGDVYLAIVERGEEYRVDPFDPHWMDYAGKANEWEVAAYATGKTTHNAQPYSDESGTYLGAFTPIFRGSKVVGVVAAEYDSATLGELEGLVKNAFWLSLLPAALIALIVAWLLAGMFVEPMEVFRQIQEAASAEDRAALGAGAPGRLALLTPKERECADLVARALENKEIAETLHMGSETVKTHIANILSKTGLKNRVAVAVEVVAASRR